MHRMTSGQTGKKLLKNKRVSYYFPDTIKNQFMRVKIIYM